MSTGSGHFAPLNSDFEQNFGQIVPIRIKTLCNTNLVASRHIIEKKAHFWLTLRRSKRSRLKLLVMLFGVKISPSFLTCEQAIGYIYLWYCNRKHGGNSCSSQYPYYFSRSFTHNSLPEHISAYLTTHLWQLFGEVLAVGSKEKCFLSSSGVWSQQYQLRR